MEIPVCTRGGDHQELLHSAVTDRLREISIRHRPLAMREASVLCLRCRQEIPLELDERVR